MNLTPVQLYRGIFLPRLTKSAFCDRIFKNKDLSRPRQSEARFTMRLAGRGKAFFEIKGRRFSR